MWSNFIAIDLTMLATVGAEYTLVLGIVGVATGFVLLIAHRHSFDAAMEREDTSRTRTFESKKYRRRTLVSALVTGTGFMIAALYWVTDPKIFAVFILLILLMLMAILAIAFIDLFSVSLYSLTKTDDAARKAMVEEYLRQRKNAGLDDSDDSGQF